MADFGGTAFPSGLDFTTGMSLRDYFAGQALTQALMAAGTLGDIRSNANEWARTCYALADAMLEARKK